MKKIGGKGMLVKATKEDILKHMDFVYELALDQTKSLYPTYTDGIKSKEDFINVAFRAFSSANTEILFFEYEGNIEGWIQYYWVEEDMLVGINSFNINIGIHVAIEQFINLMNKNYKGFEMHIGLPKCNVQALSYLEQKGYKCIEELHNNSFFFDDYNPITEEDNIFRITKDNFTDFEMLHKSKDKEMFWNSSRLYESIDKWNIYVYYKNNKPQGAIYFTNLEIMLEIFGIDYIGGKYDEQIFELLLCKALNEGKLLGAKYLTFFTDEDSQELLTKLGFKYIGKYVCYLLKLG